MTVLDTKELWNKALIEIELNLSKTAFTTWFKNTSVVGIEDGTVAVGVQNEFIRDWLSSKHHKLILKALRGVYDSVRAVEYVISKTDTPKVIPLKQVEVSHQTPLFTEQNITREDGLNPRYTFESFVVGPFNELAYVAAQAIINNPGTMYNPFFVHGSTGIGKTHLIQSIGNSLKTKYPHKRVFYTSLERFSNDYVQAVNANKASVFADKYKKYDVLIMDDIQFIRGKEKTQEELFHVFNTLYDLNKQIVFSSDKHPNFIQGLEDRLRTRFSQGMIVDISNPDYESRLAVLKVKAGEATSFLTDEVLSFIAESVQGSIRELEGMLNMVIAQTTLKGRSLYVHEVRQLIKHNISTKKSLSIQEVVAIVADYYSLAPEMMYKKSRQKEIVRPRQIAMYILREVYDHSFPSIGEKLGGRDHTTVMHSVDKIKTELQNNPVLMQEIDEIKSLCV